MSKNNVRVLNWNWYIQDLTQNIEKNMQHQYKWKT